MHKDKELFFFFNITDVAGFKSHLADDLFPLITSATQSLNNTNTNTTLINIAFSQKGFDVLGIPSSDLDDSLFSRGQANQATALNDGNGTAGWQDEFKPGNGMHGVILIASDDVDAVNNQASSLVTTFDNSIVEVYRLLGRARPGMESGHERKLPGLCGI
jgi:deferrochelatase/peroxidase EfeB